MTKVNLLDICAQIGVLDRIDIRVIRPPKTMQQTYSAFSRTYSKGSEFLAQYKSIIVYCMYTNVSYEYYVRDEFTPTLQAMILRNVIRKNGYQNITFSSDYSVLRKELAVRAGLGLIGKNALLFNHQFGFDCKIDMLATSIEFDNYDLEYTGDYRMTDCDNCDCCIKSCSVDAMRAYVIYDINKCDVVLNETGKYNRHEMCRECIVHCPRHMGKSPKGAAKIES